MKRTTMRKTAKRGRPEIPAAEISKITRTVKQDPAPNGTRWTVRAVAERFGISTGKASEILRELHPLPMDEEDSFVPEEVPSLPPTAFGAKVNMADVARAAGVSKQTVSRALRGAAGISDKTRKKIIGLAGRMGYRPNPLTAALMTDIRRRKQNDTGTTILMLHDLEREPASYGNERGLTLVAYYHAAKARAEQLGYHLDTLGYAEPGMTGERIDGILKARGIRGVYITGRSPVPDLDWDHYAVVCGRRPGIPCYSVLPDCPYNMELALRQACDLGYRRVGLVLDPDYDASVEYFGAYHSFRYAHRDLRLLEPFDCGGQDTEARLNRWFDRQKPDLILTLWTGSPFCQTIEDRVRNAPEHIGLVVLGLPPAKPYLAGIDYCLTTCAESAINLLHEQLINNRFGKLPIAARILHIRGEWHSGQTAFCQTR